MATLRVWAGFHECQDIASLHGVAVALKEAADAAQEAGCEVKIVAGDLGDQGIAAKGTPQAVAAAAGEFAERGFDPVVTAGSEEEVAELNGLVPAGIGVDLEA